MRSAEKPLAAAETRMLATARRIVASELAMALAITKDEAERRIDKAFS